MRRYLYLWWLLLFPLTAVAQDLPKCVQELPPAQYEAWAYWQNAQSEAQSRGYEPRHLYFDKTTIARSGGTRMSGTTSGESRRFRGRTTRHGSTSRDMRAWGVTTAYMVPQRYNNPDYVPQPVTYYNPFVKSRAMGTSPDWDNLFITVDGEIVTVTEAITRSAVPVSPETLYRWFIEGCFDEIP